MRRLAETSYVAQRADQQQHKNNRFDPKLWTTALNHRKGLWGRRPGEWDDSVLWELGVQVQQCPEHPGQSMVRGLGSSVPVSALL